MKSYLKLLNDVLNKGESHDDRTGVGTTSLFGYQWRHDLKKGFPLLTTKKLPFRWIAEELFWFLSGSTDEDELEDKQVDIWKEWADLDHTRRFGRKAGDLGPIYGFQWRHFGAKYDKGRFNGYGGFDQIKWLVNEIQTNPTSRRLIVTAWHPEQATEVTLPPCHSFFQFKVHQPTKTELGDSTSELSCHLYARSIDAFLGLPFNIASYALLTHLIAHVTDLTVRDLVISFGDLHIYNNHREQVELQLSREPDELPELEIGGWEGKFHKSGFEGLMQMGYKDLELLGYRPQGKISAPVAV